MGFKRTAEGRVFFETAPQQETRSSGNDLQLAGLLRALNEKLKESQYANSRIVQEMESLRRTIHELESRAERSEQSYIELEQKIAERQNETLKKADRAEKTARETLDDILEARNALSEIQDKNQGAEQTRTDLAAQLEHSKKFTEEMRKRQAVLEKMHKDQAAKMVDHVAAYVTLTKRVAGVETQYEALDNKIGDVALKHSQLERKFEKSNEDRLRLLRKIDRIEETVLQMRDTLNAKAMVVLRDSAMPDVLPESPRAEPLMAREPVVLKDTAPKAATFKIPASLITGATAVLLLVALGITGEAIIPAVKTKFFTQAEAPFTEANWQPLVVEDRLVSSEVIETEQIPQQEEAQQPAENTTAESQTTMAEEIGAVDLNNEEDLLAALENNPDALAAQLNALEPGTENTEEVTVAAVDAQQDIAQSEQPAAQETAGVLSLKERIQPDTRLPQKIQELETQAFAGVAEAQHDLAALYTAGQGGVKTDYERAAQWFREAARNGVPNAAYNLGVLYHQGMGVERSLSEALDWYRVAAEKNHPEAQYNLGIAYIEGIGVEYDPVKASDYFENAAQSGITEAAYNLGLIYENGLLGDAKPQEALKWYKTAADKGSPEAKAALEQLAKTLGIDVKDINDVVESTGQKNSAAEPQASPPLKLAAIEATVSESTPQNEERSITARIQQHLMQLGLYPGPADGVTGPLTADAIRSFQAISNRNVDGRATGDLLAFMEEQSVTEAPAEGSLNP